MSAAFAQSSLPCWQNIATDLLALEIHFLKENPSLWQIFMAHNFKQD